LAIIWNICEVEKERKPMINFWDIPALKYGFYSILICLNLERGTRRRLPLPQRLLLGATCSMLLLECLRSEKEEFQIAFSF
jgi:hypothetical protein